MYPEETDAALETLRQKSERLKAFSFHHAFLLAAVWNLVGMYDLAEDRAQRMRNPMRQFKGARHHAHSGGSRPKAGKLGSQ